MYSTPIRLPSVVNNGLIGEAASSSGPEATDESLMNRIRLVKVRRVLDFRNN